MLPLHAPVFTATLAATTLTATLVTADDLGVLFATRHISSLKSEGPKAICLRAYAFFLGKRVENLDSYKSLHSLLYPCQQISLDT